MSDDDCRERIRALEVEVIVLNQRMDRFETFCRETQQVYRDSFSDMNERIEKFVNHKVHDLESQIKDAKHTNREPLSLLDWTKIVVAGITITGTIIVALIQAGILS